VPNQEVFEIENCIIRVSCQPSDGGMMTVALEICGPDGIALLSTLQTVERGCSAEFDVDAMAVRVTMSN